MIFRSESNDNNESKGKILFYHVDSSIVSILKKEFQKSEIVVLEADNKSDGTKLLKKEAPDVVLADYAPELNDSVDFLTYVKKKHASTNRILLSPPEHEQAVLNLMLKNIANSYFENPHGLGHVLESVSHLLEVRQILKNKQLVKLLNVTDELTSHLKTYYDFVDAIEADKSVKDLAAIVEKDISISTRVLKIANSAFYRSGRIGSVERACIYLGMETIKNIVFTVSLSSVKKLSREQNRYLDRIIYHSVKVNQNFQRFYRLETGHAAPQNYKSLGITHDIGKIIMLQYMPEMFDKIIRYKKKNPDVSFYRCELELGQEGCTHAEIGAHFLDLWHFPEVNTYTALFHHTPEAAFDSYRELLDIFSFVNEFAK